MIKKIIASIMVFCFLLGSVPAHSFELGWLPVPGAMVSSSPDLRPALFQGLRVDLKDAYHFQFLMEEAQGPVVAEETDRSLRYFLTALTVPEKDIWVNLSPIEKDRIVPLVLADTEMGRDLLAQDYLLKQLASSLLYPDGVQGKEFWNRVYARAQREFGTNDIPLDVMNKVWITPGDIMVQEKDHVAVISKATLKVMVEEDYLLLKSQGINAGEAANGQRILINDVFRQVVIPELEREVNTGAHFARVRQIYHSLILAAWYKRRFHQGAVAASYVDQGKTPGVATEDKALAQAVYARYVDAYKKGVFDFIRDEADDQGSALPRKYFSGGLDLGPNMAQAFHTTPLVVSPLFDGALNVIDVNTRRVDGAQKAEDYLVDVLNANNRPKMGNKGWHLVENNEVLKDRIPPFEILSADLYKDYRAGKISLDKVVAVLWQSPKIQGVLQGKGSLAVRAAGTINMPGVLPTDKKVTTPQEVVESIMRIYDIWDSPQAQEYLQTQEAREVLDILVAEGVFPDRQAAMSSGPAIVVQQEVFGDLGAESGSGVMRSRSPMTGKFLMSGSYGVQMAPEKLRNGDWEATNVPKHFSWLRRQEGNLYALLKEKAERLEAYHGWPVEIEFIVEKGQLYIVQVNKQFIPPSMQTLVYMRMADDGRIARNVVPLPEGKLMRSVGQIKSGATFDVLDAQSIGLSAGAVDGFLAFDIDQVKALNQDPLKKGRIVLVSDDFNQPGLLKALVSGQVNGMITTYGDSDMHLARIAAEGLIPAVSLAANKIAKVVREGSGKLEVGGKVFVAGDRLAIVAEDIMDEDEIIHVGKVLLPRQEELVVELTDMVIPDLDFDSDKLREDITRKFADAEPLALTATHALLKRISKNNTVKEKEAVKLEVATNTIHKLLMDKMAAMDVVVNGAREDVFLPIANGFGPMLFKESYEDGSKNAQFLDVKSVDDIEGLLVKMASLVEKYKKLSTAGMAYLNYPALVTKDVPLEFTITFPEGGERVNWEYENPALWAYVRQAKPQVFYQSSAYLNGAPGPFLKNIVFAPNSNPFEIRVKGDADILQGAPGASFTVKMSNGGRLESLGGYAPEWHSLSIKDFNDYIGNKVSTVIDAYPVKKPGKTYAIERDINNILKNNLSFSRSQEGMVELLVDKGRNYRITLEQNAEDLSGRAVALAKGDAVWRWYQQDVGSYYAEGSGSTLRDPNTNWIKESRFLIRLLKHKKMFPGSKAWHRAGYQNSSDSGGHGLKAFFQRVYYSWIVLDEKTISSLNEAVANLSQKYDVRAMLQKHGDEERLDLEGVLMMLFLNNGGTREELIKMAQVDNAAVGGIDLDLTGKKLGADQAPGTAADMPMNATDIIKGLVPVIIGQQKINSAMDFVQL
ncbi:MAG: hypothetical protein HQL17_03210 [Candidatus Omnitrophica bacterium]|nr:hypothetical protein [Candidatus Omnitrophota bacterium]